MNYHKFPILLLMLGAFFFILFTSGCTGPVELNAAEQPTPIADTLPVTPTISVSPETICVPSEQIIVTPPPTPAVTIPESALIGQLRQAVGRFSNDPRDDLIFTGINHLPYGDLYEFRTGNSSYDVNNVTGSVQSAVWYEAGNKNQKEVIDQNQGYAIAESFAKEKHPAFWPVSNKRVIKKVPVNVIDSGSERKFSYSWYEIMYDPDKNTAPHTESIGQNSISVDVSPYTGHILSYVVGNDPRDPTSRLTPSLTREQAWKYAEAYFLSIGLSDPQPREVDYRDTWIVADSKKKQHLTYSFDVEQKDNYGITYGGVVWIDARDGSVIEYAGIA